MDKIIYLNSLVDEKTKNKRIKNVLDRDLYYIVDDPITKVFWLERVCSLLGACNTDYELLIKNTKKITGYRYLYEEA